jgi:hypothetical protein
MKPCTRFGKSLAALWLLAPLGACTPHAPTATPPLVLPALQRPLVALRTPPAGERDVLIPRAAYLERGGLPGVFVLRDGQARFHMVRTGKTYGDRLQILSGLRGDETLVLGALSDVHDGSPIVVK